MALKKQNKTSHIFYTENGASWKMFLFQRYLYRYYLIVTFLFLITYIAWFGFFFSFFFLKNLELLFPKVGNVTVRLTRRAVSACLCLMIFFLTRTQLQMRQTFTVYVYISHRRSTFCWWWLEVFYLFCCFCFVCFCFSKHGFFVQQSPGCQGLALWARLASNSEIPCVSATGVLGSKATASSRQHRLLMNVLFCCLFT